MNSPIFVKLATVAGVLALAACGQSAQQPASAGATAAATSAGPVAAAPAVAQNGAQDGAPQTAKPVLAPAVPAQTAPAAEQPQNMAAAPVAAAHATAESGGKPDTMVIRGYAAKWPSAWTPTPTSSSMRVAQFAIPAAKGADAGEVAVFYFAPGQGGSHEANIERWTSQFTGPGGLPAMPQTSVSKSGDTEVTLVELQGNYARGIGMGPAGEPRPDQMLIVAMVEAPIGRITLQMYGPSKTVTAQRDNFVKLAKGFRQG